MPILSLIMDIVMRVSKESARGFPNIPNSQKFVNTHRHFQEFCLKHNRIEHDVRDYRHRYEILQLFDTDNRMRFLRTLRQLRA